MILGLQTLRKSCGLTQDALADRIKVKRLTIYRYESGVCIPGMEKIGNLSKALNCEPWQLFHPKPYEAALLIELGKRWETENEPVWGDIDD